MKNYLNNQEMKEIIILNYIKDVVDNFANGNVLNNKEKGNLKRGSTFIKNTLKDLILRLGPAEAKKFVKSYNQNRVVVINDSELNIICKRRITRMDASYEENKDYLDLVEIVMDMNCKDCKRDCQECDLKKYFEEQEVIPFYLDDDGRFIKDLGNCQFAYLSEDVKKDGKK